MSRHLRSRGGVLRGRGLRLEGRYREDNLRLKKDKDLDKYAQNAAHQRREKREGQEVEKGAALAGEPEDSKAQHHYHPHKPTSSHHATSPSHPSS